MKRSTGAEPTTPASSAPALPPPRPTQLLRATEIARRLGISRSHFYTLPFFRERRVWVTDTCVGWRESDVELYIPIRSGGGERR